MHPFLIFIRMTEVGSVWNLKKKQIYIYIALKYLRNGRKLNAYDNKRILKGDAKRNYYESN